MLKLDTQWEDAVCSKMYKIDFVKEVYQDLLYLKENYHFGEKIVLKLKEFLLMLGKFLNGDTIDFNIFNQFLSFFCKLVRIVWIYEINSKNDCCLVHSISNNDFMNAEKIFSYFNSKEYLSCSCINDRHKNLYNENKWGFILRGKINIFSTHYFDSMTFIEDEFNFKTIKIVNNRNISCWECVTDLKTPKQILSKNIAYQGDLGPDINYNEIVVASDFRYIKGVFCLSDFEDKQKIKKLSLDLNLLFHIIN